MAGIQWSGGKLKGSAEVKANFRHNDKSERMRREHSNPDINLAETQNNFSYRGLSYYQKCKQYDERLSELEQGRQATGKNARVTMQSLVIYAPKDLPQERIKDWFQAVGKILEDKYGRDFIEMDVHMDEIHDYIDPSSGEVVTSRAHGHAALIPEVDGKLNGKKFCSRKNINDLNKAVNEMTIEKYGIPYILGKGAKNNKSVEELKRASENAKREMELIAQEHQTALSANEQLKQENEKLTIKNKTIKKEMITMAERISQMQELIDKDEFMKSFKRKRKIRGKLGEEPKVIEENCYDEWRKACDRKKKRDSGMDLQLTRFEEIENSKEEYDDEYEL